MSTTATDAFVTVRDLRKVFDVSKPWLERTIERAPKQFLKAVDGLSFDIRKGETFALVGESGSGKSTVARMVVGLLPATGGEVMVDGVSMTATRGFGGAGPDAPADPDDLPGPLRFPQSALAGEGHHRRTDPRVSASSPPRRTSRIVWGNC